MTEPRMGWEIEYHGPGDEAAGPFGVGDFLLTHQNHWIARLIRLGQTIRYTGRYRKHARWGHAALIVSEEGYIAEALDQGVVRNHISRYRDTEYILVRIDCPDIDRSQIGVFAESVLKHRWHYSYLTIVSIVVGLSAEVLANIGRRIVFFEKAEKIREPRRRFNLSISGTAICSAFVAEALVRAGVVFEFPPGMMMPADLSYAFQVDPPKQQR